MVARISAKIRLAIDKMPGEAPARPNEHSSQTYRGRKDCERLIKFWGST